MLNLMWAADGADVILFPIEPAVDAVYAHTAVALGFNLWSVPSISTHYYGAFELSAASVSDAAATLAHALSLRGRSPLEASRRARGAQLSVSETEAALAGGAEGGGAAGGECGAAAG